jgi:hypothetical protein
MICYTRTMATKSTSQKTESIYKKGISKLKLNLPVLTLLIIGFVVGILWFGGLRFLLVHPSETHYHANFAVYINGQREEFKSFGYYEEIAACTSDYANNVKGRSHMHDNINNVIHIHDTRVTYQDFFENLGWSIGPDYVHTDTTLYSNNDHATVKYILNGNPIDRVDNKIINDKDRLLVSYGDITSDSNTQFKTVAQTAATVDAQKDPASCSGLNGPADESASTRLKRAIGIE